MLATKERIDIQIDREEVLRYLGYRAGHKAEPRISSLVDRHTRSAYPLIEPQYSYVIRDVEHVEWDRVFIEDVVFESRIIAQLMQRCQKAAIFAVTIGGLLERKARRLAEKGQILEAAIVDAVGSEAAEAAAAAVQNRVRDIADAWGLGISNRFSPGYCDWDISQQEMVFRALNGRSTGVTLTKNCLMVPRKSVSGVIGMGTDASELEIWSPCKSCKRGNCPGRR
jgi:hypothetical protein